MGKTRQQANVVSDGFLTTDLSNKYNAVDLVKIGSKIIGGSGGGGRNDFAQAGGDDVENIEKSFQAILKKIKK